MYTVAVFVQANFGSRRDLTIAGRPVGRLLDVENPQEAADGLAPGGAGSVIGIDGHRSPGPPSERVAALFA